MTEPSTVVLEDLLQRANGGDRQARDELFNGVIKRLRQLVERMKRDYARLDRWVEVDDVLQDAAVRLCQSFLAVRPDSLRAFFRLAGRDIRWTLLDMVRKFYGPEGLAANYTSRAGGENSSGGPVPVPDGPESTYDPARLASWTELHRRVEELRDEEREVFDLLWYQGLPQAEAAAILGVSEVTVRRRWGEARLHLRESLHGSAVF